MHLRHLDDASHSLAYHPDDLKDHNGRVDIEDMWCAVRAHAELQLKPIKMQSRMLKVMTKTNVPLEINCTFVCRKQQVPLSVSTWRCSSSRHCVTAKERSAASGYITNTPASVHRVCAFPLLSHSTFPF